MQRKRVRCFLVKTRILRTLRAGTPLRGKERLGNSPRILQQALRGSTSCMLESRAATCSNYLDSSDSQILRTTVLSMSLFEAAEAQNRQSVQPLAARMRPRNLHEFCGQQHFLGEGKLLRRLLQSDRLGSLIFYGPPGTGKNDPCPSACGCNAESLSPIERGNQRG